jgi:hypothetical protein
MRGNTLASHCNTKSSVDILRTQRRAGAGASGKCPRGPGAMSQASTERLLEPFGDAFCTEDVPGIIRAS